MAYKETFLNKLERKMGRHSISNLMMYIVGGMGVVFLLDLLLYPTTQISVSSLLAFDRNAILHGQVWRLITFILIPPDSSVLFILFSLYFYYFIGNALERQWGSFRFNVYYLCGIIGTIIAGMITGFSTNSYLNLSLYLAFAILYPNNEVLLFFFLPVKMKYLAIVDAALLTYMFIFDSLSGKIALVAALINLILFFFNDFMDMIKAAKRRRDFNKSTNNYWKNK